MYYILLYMLFSVFDGMWLSLTLPNAMHICIRIITFRKTLIQIQANLFKMFFPPNIEQAKYNMFTVSHTRKGITQYTMTNCLKLDLPEKISHVCLTSKTEKKRINENYAQHQMQQLI